MITSGSAKIYHLDKMDNIGMLSSQPMDKCMYTYTDRVYRTKNMSGPISTYSNIYIYVHNISLYNIYRIKRGELIFFDRAARSQQINYNISNVCVAGKSAKRQVSAPDTDYISELSQHYIDTETAYGYRMARAG